jgi:hypothetical protein
MEKTKAKIPRNNIPKFRKLKLYEVEKIDQLPLVGPRHSKSPLSRAENVVE